MSSPDSKYAVSHLKNKKQNKKTTAFCTGFKDSKLCSPKMNEYTGTQTCTGGLKGDMEITPFGLRLAP
jgi:hypothetical protein